MATITEIFNLTVGETGDFAESEFVDENDVAKNITGFAFELRVDQPAGVITFAGVITTPLSGLFKFVRDGTKFIEGRHDSVLKITDDSSNISYATNLVFLVDGNLS